MKLLLLFVALAQAPSPSFDAASIKANRSGEEGYQGAGFGRSGGTSYTRQNVTAGVLIEEAYGMPTNQVIGLPAWAKSDRYDINARPEHPVDRATGLAMLRTLLAERLGLRVHHEEVAVNGFHLVVDRGGSKLRAAAADARGFSFGLDRIRGGGEMRELANILRGLLAASVEDHTGLTGKYEVDLHWTASDLASTEPSVTLYAAIRDQAGLSLEAAKVTVGVERPTEN